MTSANRINSIDVFRLFAITAVIAIHTTFFSPDQGPYEYAYELVSQLSRYAVPFFFVVSGFFWGHKARSCIDISIYTTSVCKHLLFLFVVWSLIYILPINFGAMYDYGVLGPVKVVYWRILTLSEEPLKFFFQGTRAHLWFIPSLITAMLIANVFIARGWLKSLVLLSIILYIVGVLANAYADTPVGIYSYFNTGFGPFMGLALFVTGYGLSGTTQGKGYVQLHTLSYNKHWFWSGVVLFTLGSVSHIMEIAYLHNLYGTNVRMSYVFGTYFAGLGAALMALSNSTWFDNQKLANIGKLTLGVYLIHYVFVDMFDFVDKLTSHPAWEVSYIVIVLVFSIVSVKWMMHWQWTRRLVT